MLLPKLKITPGPRAIIFFTLPEWNKAKEKFSMVKKENFLNVQFKYNDKGVILGPLIGAPFLGIILEILKILKIKEIIGFGWAGKLNPKVNIGDLIVPVKAYSLEGTSKMYFPKKKVFYPDKELLLKIEKKLKQKNIEYKKGKIISVDAPFIFEKKKEFFEKWNRKVEAMDMETSALFSLSKSLQMKSLVLHFITDEIGKIYYKKPENKISLKREAIWEVLKEFLEDK